VNEMLAFIISWRSLDSVVFELLDVNTWHCWLLFYCFSE